MSSQKPYGSLIKLREEYAEQYKALHRNAFPAVLDRIALSNIANYTIALSQGMLFGFYDYVGKDYKMDMSKIAEDEATQQWWKLTEPMQLPLRDRQPGEWWTSIELIHSFSKEHHGLPTIRRFFRAADLYIDVNEFKKLFDNNLIDKKIVRSETFRHKNEIYIYAEMLIPEKHHEHTLKIETDWPASEYFKEMEEIFHTDGCQGK